MYTSNNNNNYRQHNHVTLMPYANGGLNSRSRSVPEGLAHPNGDIHWNYNQRNVARPYARQQQGQHVLEQLTTTV